MQRSIHRNNRLKQHDNTQFLAARSLMRSGCQPLFHKVAVVLFGPSPWRIHFMLWAGCGSLWNFLMLTLCWSAYALLGASLSLLWFAAKWPFCHIIGCCCILSTTSPSTSFHDFVTHHHRQYLFSASLVLSQWITNMTTFYRWSDQLSFWHGSPVSLNQKPILFVLCHRYYSTFLTVVHPI